MWVYSKKRDSEKTFKDSRFIYDFIPAEKIEVADKKSFEIVKKIHRSMSLQPAAPSEKDGIDKCICFAECNLPGSINHCERYGRFGFVFRKNVVFGLGGRPAIYADNDIAPI